MVRGPFNFLVLFVDLLSYTDPLILYINPITDPRGLPSPTWFSLFLSLPREKIISRGKGHEERDRILSKFINGSCFVATRVPVPSNGRGAGGVLPQQEDQRSQNRFGDHPWSWPLQVWALGAPKYVFLHSTFRVCKLKEHELIAIDHCSFSCLEILVSYSWLHAEYTAL